MSILWWIQHSNILVLIHHRAGHKSPHEDESRVASNVSLLDTRTVDDSDDKSIRVYKTRYRTHPSLSPFKFDIPSYFGNSLPPEAYEPEKVDEPIGILNGVNTATRTSLLTKSLQTF